MNGPEVVVVGAGLSGLVAATRLSREGVSVLVLEARARVGGRLSSEELEGARFDVGGQWLGPGQHRMYRLAKELDLETFPTHHAGTKLLSIDGDIRRYEGSIPKLGMLELLQLQATFSFIERASKNIGKDPWTSSRAATLDSLSVGAVERMLQGRALRASFEAAVRTVFGAEPSELSLLWLLYYAKASGGFMRLVEIEGGAQQDRIVGGAESIPAALGRALGDRLLTEAPVHSIARRDDGVKLVSGRGTFAARHAIIAVPPPLVSRVEWSPPLPRFKSELCRRMPMGSTIKVLALYESPFWRSAGLSGEAVCDGKPLSVVFDNCVPDGPACLVGFIVGQPAREHASRPEEDRKKLVLSELGRLFGPPAREPLRYLEKDWSAEPFIGGCPVATLGPGVLTTSGPALRENVGPVHFAGTETATAFNGYMEGAVESGERAAQEVLTALGGG